MPGAGLERETWRDVVASLEEFLPYYERVNRASTWFRLSGWRERASRSVRAHHRVLEIGPGPGGFAATLDAQRLYLLEPSAAILRFAVQRLDGGGIRALRGVAESIPLRSNEVDRVFCIFAFRDFLDKRGSLAEILRVLAPGGELHIVDLFRAEARLHRLVMDLWLAHGAPVVLRLLVPPSARRGWKHDPYVQLHRTFQEVGSVSLYADLMRDVGFVDVETTDLLLRSVYHLKGGKPSTT